MVFFCDNSQNNWLLYLYVLHDQKSIRTSVNIFVSDTIPRRLHLRMHLCTTTYCDLQTIKYTTTVAVCIQGNTNGIQKIIIHNKLPLLNFAH